MRTLSSWLQTLVSIQQSNVRNYMFQLIKHAPSSAVYRHLSATGGLWIAHHATLAWKVIVLLAFYPTRLSPFGNVCRLLFELCWSKEDVCVFIAHDHSVCVCVCLVFQRCSGWIRRPGCHKSLPELKGRDREKCKCVAWMLMEFSNTDGLSV